MGWFDRRKPRSPDRAREQAAEEHLAAFVRSRRGVEAFLEPRTTMTEHTVLLVAYDGEWTRRRVAGPREAYQFTRRLSIPLYDVQLLGYPQRMRDFNERCKVIERRRSAEADWADSER